MTCVRLCTKLIIRIGQCTSTKFVVEFSTVFGLQILRGKSSEFIWKIKLLYSGHSTLGIFQWTYRWLRIMTYAIQTWEPKSWEVLMSIWEVLFQSLGSIFPFSPTPEIIVSTYIQVYNMWDPYQQIKRPKPKIHSTASLIPKRPKRPF